MEGKKCPLELKEYDMGHVFNKIIDPPTMGDSGLVDVNHRAYLNFVSSLKSSITRKSICHKIKELLAITFDILFYF